VFTRASPSGRYPEPVESTRRFFFILKMEAAGFYKTSVNIYQSTRRRITEDSNILTALETSNSHTWNVDRDILDARTANGVVYKCAGLLRDGGSLPNRARDILFTTVSTLVLGPTQPPVQ
jgi:hypothetical protein